MKFLNTALTISGIFFVPLLIMAPSASARSLAEQDVLDRSLRQEAIAGVIPRIVELVKLGADVNGKAPHGESALEYAIRFGRHGAALTLLNLGANPNSEDDTGLSPLLRATESCGTSKVVDALLHAGANVNHRDYYGRTALMNAARSDCERTVAIIILRTKDKVEIDARDESGASASELAKEGWVPEMLEMARDYQHSGDPEKLVGVAKKAK